MPEGTLFKTIVVPIDLNEPELATSAIEKAAALAMQSGGAVRLLTVLPVLPPSFLDYVRGDFDVVQRQAAVTDLDKLAAAVPLPRERVSTKIRIGSIYSEILAGADEFGADLIVIGSHRPAMAAYLLGSNARKVVSHAKCSVLVVRDKPA
jgi:nucleotide-binding universal stress UspA family protein